MTELFTASIHKVGSYYRALFTPHPVGICELRSFADDWLIGKDVRVGGIAVRAVAGVAATGEQTVLFEPPIPTDQEGTGYRTIRQLAEDLCINTTSQVNIVDGPPSTSQENRVIETINAEQHRPSALVAPRRGDYDEVDRAVEAGEV